MTIQTKKHLQMYNLIFKYFQKIYLMERRIEKEVGKRCFR